MNKTKDKVCNTKEIGNNLRKLRENLHLSKEEVSAKTYFDIAHIVDLENGIGWNVRDALLLIYYYYHIYNQELHAYLLTGIEENYFTISEDN